MTFKLITPPSLLPVSVDEAKLHCHEDGNEEDSSFESWIQSAVAQCEHIMQRAIMPQVWELTLDKFPADIELNMPNIISIDSIKYADELTESEVTLASNQYVLDDTANNEPAWILLAHGVTSWPGTVDASNTVKVRYTAGWPNSNSVPSNIKSWIKMAVGTWYANREVVRNTERNTSVQVTVPHDFYAGLLDRFIVWRI